MEMNEAESIEELSWCSSTEVDSDDKTVNRGRKRKKNQSLSERAARKLRRQSGKRYKNRSEKIIPEKTFKYIEDCCQLHCNQKLTRDDQKHLFTNFYMTSNEEQDTYLGGCLSLMNAATQKTGDIQRNRENIWKYCIKVDGSPVFVCRKLCLSLLQITEKRLHIIQAKVKEGKNFADARDHHNNRPRNISENVWELAKKHLEGIPHQESHYSTEKSRKKCFENSSLNVVTLFRLFQTYYREQTNKPLKLNYQTYFKFFKN